MSARKRILANLALAIGAISLVVVFACTGEGRAKDKPRFTYKDGDGPNGAVMTIDGKPVSLEELLGEDKLEYVDLVTKVYEFKKNKAGDALLDAVYRDEAKKAGMPVARYLEAKVLKSDPKISDAEYNKFIVDRKVPKEQLAQNPQLKDQILRFMKGQKMMEEREKLVVKLSKDHNVVLFLKKPDIKVEVEVGNSPSYGNKASKVKVVEFSDFQCPYCSRAADTITQLKKLYGNKIQIAFKHYPLPMHPQARPASEASMCMNEQSADKFWKYHDKLFANQDKLDDESLKKYAKELGANMDQFTKCFQEKKFAQLVQEDMDYGGKIGVRSTPTFFINGKLIPGAQPIENFKEIIDNELAGG